MSKDFSLLDEPWLPVRLADGQVEALGLREVFRRSREIVALARVFVDRDGNKHPLLEDAKRTLGDPRGGTVRIGQLDGDHLNLAEGFEEAESVIALCGLPGCWSVNGAELYTRVHIPDHIRTITIYSQHGTAASNGVAKATPHLSAGGRRIKVELPPPGGDWNDAWRAA